MAPSRLDNILIIQPRSGLTTVQFGLQDDVFAVPDLEIPSVIYKEIKDGKDVYHPEPNESTESIEFIKNGDIVDIEAFLQFLKLILVSLLNEKLDSTTKTFVKDYSNVSLCIISNHKWSQTYVERITRFTFESLKIASFMVLPTGLATTHAMIALQNSLIIDIGKYHTDIIPIVDYLQIEHLTSTLPIGGNDINVELSKILPELSETQIEDLKTSNIFEVLSDDAKRNSIFDFQSTMNDERDSSEGLDVAAIITSGRDTREILEEREKKLSKQDVPNSQLETNSYLDRNGDSISVGKQRFHGCDDLIDQISQRVGLIISMIDDVTKQKSLWENLVIIGGSSSINGFQDALLTKLIDDHLVTEPEDEKLQREKHAMELRAAFSKNKKKQVGANFVSILEYTQVPTIIKFAKHPEYFPEWKKFGYANVAFMGGQIVSKQIFTHSKDTFSLTKENYSESGPSAIWEVVL